MCKMCDYAFRVNAVQRLDPTHTTTIRRRYEQELGARMRKLKGAIIQKIIGQDTMGLRVNFSFGSDATKVDAFMDWLAEEQGKTLGVYKGASSTASNNSWANVYIDSAYKVGVNQSASELKKGGATVDARWTEAAFTRPIHADRVGILYTRNYSGLVGITTKIESSVAQVLAGGMISGAGPHEIARQINKQVSRYTGDAKRLARTEIINAHAESTLNSYEEAGIQGVDVVSEMLTASDACQRCQDIAKRGPYKLSEARGIIPVHPNCRCAWKPVVQNGTGIVLR